MAKTPEQIASSIVESLHFSTNRMVDGRLLGEQCFAYASIRKAIQDERDNKFTQEQIEQAADALRRHEMSGRNLNSWDLISAGQRRKWIAKAKIVLEAAE